MTQRRTEIRRLVENTPATALSKAWLHRACSDLLTDQDENLQKGAAYDRLMEWLDGYGPEDLVTIPEIRAALAGRETNHDTTESD